MGISDCIVFVLHFFAISDLVVFDVLILFLNVFDHHFMLTISQARCIKPNIFQNVATTWM